MPEVSVLLPVRNGEAWLRECLDSLLCQTLADIEIVAVCNGSDDASPRILDEVAASDARLRVVQVPAVGIVGALNVALREARSELIARMDADDIANPLRLALQARALAESQDVDILATRVRLVSQPGMQNEGMQAYVEWSNNLVDHDAIVRDLFVESPLVHPSVMMRRSRLESLGGYRDFDGPEDYDLWLRAHRRGRRFAKLPAVLLSWRDRPERLTRQDPRYSPEAFLALKLEALQAGPLGEGRSVVVWGAGPIGKSWARALAARGVDLAAFVEVDPDKIGQRIHNVPVVEVSGATAFRGALHLAAVGDHEARARIREAAADLGLADGRDMIAVA